MRGSRFFSAALFVFALTALAPHPSGAVDDCFDCVLGIWDDPGLTRNFGSIAVGTPKTIYLGMDFADRSPALTGIEFSIAGIRQVEDGILVLGSTWPIGPPVIGSLSAPADTSETSTEVGGLNLAWAECLQGTRVFTAITLLSSAPQTNKVLRVLRKYPPSRPEFSHPCFIQCDAPQYTPTLVRGGCYILNWDGVTDLGCNTTVAVESSTWSGMKALFR